MKVAYIAGPYRAASESQKAKNIERARKIAIELWQMGYAVICPHSNSSFMDSICSDEVWLAGYVEIMKRVADVVVLIPGWQNSDGALAEAWVARREEITLLVWPEDKLEIERIAGKVDF